MLLKKGSTGTSELPSRAATNSTVMTDDSLPDVELGTTAKILVSRLEMWKNAVESLEKYAEALEKIYSAHSKEYKRALKALESFKEGQPQAGEVGIATFFETLRKDSRGMMETNKVTGDKIELEVSRVLHALHKSLGKDAHRIKHDAKKAEKAIKKSTTETQESIEELARRVAAYCSAGSTVTAREDPYVMKRKVEHNMFKRTELENANSADLARVEGQVRELEANAIAGVKGAMEALRNLVVRQAQEVEKGQDTSLHAIQQVMPEAEWKAFFEHHREDLVDPNAPLLIAAERTFHNKTHSSTEAAIQGTLDRKSRNKLSWGWQSAFYVVTPAGYLHEFVSEGNHHGEDTHYEPKLSVYLPDAAAIEVMDKGQFKVKGKDTSGKLGGKMAGSSELVFKTDGPLQAAKWVDVMKGAGRNREAAPVAAANITASPTAASPIAASPLASPVAEAPAEGPASPLADTKPVSPLSTVPPSAPAPAPVLPAPAEKSG